MTLNSSGPISLAGSTTGQSIALELGLSATAAISLNTTAVRTLAGVPSGAITMPTNFYGKSNRVSISYTFTSSTANSSLSVSAIGGYVSGKSDITVTVNGGVYLYATSTGNYGLSLSGGTTGDTLILVNNGYIMGQGGAAGGADPNASGNPVSAGGGGPALNVASIGISSITINNTNGAAYIGGGGGGGGGNNSMGGGGAAGGGLGGYWGGGCSPLRYGGGGGGIGGSGGNGDFQGPDTGGGGGRIFPGSGGSGATSGGSGLSRGGGAGGGGGGSYGCCGTNVSGSGGSSNAAGGNAPGPGPAGGGGGGWGASGGSGNADGGAAGGKAVNLGGKSVTWTSGNTSRVWGAVS